MAKAGKELTIVRNKVLPMSELPPKCIVEPFEIQSRTEGLWYLRKDTVAEITSSIKFRIVSDG